MPRPGENLADSHGGEPPPLTGWRDAVADVYVPVMGSADYGAKTHDFASIHDPPSRRREQLPNVVGEASQHVQHIRWCDHGVGRKAKARSYDTARYGIEIICSCFNEHFRLSDKPDRYSKPNSEGALAYVRRRDSHSAHRCGQRFRKQHKGNHRPSPQVEGDAIQSALKPQGVTALARVSALVEERPCGSPAEPYMFG